MIGSLLTKLVMQRGFLMHQLSILHGLVFCGALATSCGGLTADEETNSGAFGGNSPIGGGTSSDEARSAGGAIDVGGAVNTGGIDATGGSVATGGGPSTGGVSSTGGAGVGGTPQGGTIPTGGAGLGGSAQGGTVTTGGATTGGVTTGGFATGGVVGTPNIVGPCDIYASANPTTPCVAAYSTTRLLNSQYAGPLYQVRIGGSASGTGGTLLDIGITTQGFADSAAQDAACGASTCTFSILYDQSGQGNDLKVAPAGCYLGTASEADYESSANKKSITVSGHKVYALYTSPKEGYRNNTGNGMPTGASGQGIYEVADGTRTGTAAGNACCFDFGNASKNNCNGGTMNALFFGTGYWGRGAGNGPWFMADLEAGVWAIGTGSSTAVNSRLPSSNLPFAFGILKSSGSSNYAIRVGDASPAGGILTTAYDGATPKSLSNQGGIILGISGDNSNTSQGTFFEGAITTGKPSDATDELVLANVQAAQYGH